MVVDNDDVYTMFPCLFHLFNIGGPAIKADEKRDFLFTETLNGIDVEPVPLMPFRDINIGDNTNLPEKIAQDSNRGDPVSIIVSIKAYLFLFLYGFYGSSDTLFNIRQKKWVREVFKLRVKEFVGIIKVGNAS
jgi:hypothetical protein